MTPKELRAIREKFKLTQVELAEGLDVQPKIVTRWERGVLPINRVTALAMEQLAGQVEPKKPR
jgi:DNA-binding transcriptional regulator YiaG